MSRAPRGRIGDPDLSGELAFGAEDRGDVVGNGHRLLGGASGQLIGTKLGQDLLERKVHGDLVAVGCVREHAGRGGLAEFAEGDFDRAMGELGQDFVEGHGDLDTPGGGLSDLRLEAVGQFEDDGTERDLDGPFGGRGRSLVAQAGSGFDRRGQRRCPGRRGVSLGRRRRGGFWRRTFVRAGFAFPEQPL